MKKFILPLSMAVMVSFSANTAMSNEPPKPPKDCPPCHKFDKKRAEFEKLSPAEREKKMKEIQQKRIDEFDAKLNLTEEQKVKAKEIRLKGQKEIKPVMEKIRAKHKEINAVKRSRIAPEEQEKRIKALRAELKPLRAKAEKLRKKNMAEFEKILTPEQKATLEQMKKEGPKHRPPHRPVPMHK